MNAKSKARLTQRLLPLYIAAFLQELVFWYAIEKLFMITIGFNNNTIALMAVAYSVSMLLFEAPSGLLADRWSRKGVLMLAGLALALSSLIGGLSSNVVQYIIASLFFGIFFAFYSGTYDSIMYDTLIEETGNAGQYEKYYGRIRLLEGLALIISSVIGGVVGQFIGLREVYFISIPIAILSIVVLLFFKEPKLHLVSEHASLRAQVRSTFAAITQKGIVLYLLLAIVFAGLIDQIVFEFGQLWLIALAAPIILYGPINALLMSSVVIAGGVTQYFSKYKAIVVKLFVITLIFSGLSLALIKIVFIVAIALFLIAIVVIIYEILFNKQLHDRLSSNVRSGAMSAVGSLTRILFIPTALGLGFISQRFGIFNAAWILVGFIMLTAIIILRTSESLGDISANRVEAPIFLDEPHK